MTTSSGEMPFLDHLEELRGRLIKSLMAIVVAIGISLWAVLHFHLVEWFESPIVPYLPTHQLVVTSPIEPFMINMKLGIIMGLVVASPVFLYQLWGFLSPALMPRERKAIIPALTFGMLLFLAGAWLGWWILPPTFDFLLNFQKGAFTTLITVNEYVSFSVPIVLATGVCAELPLVMILLAWIGVLSYKKYIAFGRYAIFLCTIGGAIISPVPDVFWMVVCTVPLVALYGVGVGGSYIIHRRRLRLERQADA